MKKYSELIKKLKNQKGVTAIFVVIVIVVLFGLAAYAIDIGYGLVTKNQLHNISDAASLAGASRLWKIYKDNPSQATVTVPEIMDYVNHIKDSNTAAGANIVLNSGDVKLGKWDFSVTGTGDGFIETTQHPTAVRVTASRSANTGHLPLATLFARVLGINNMNPETTSTAALSGKRETPNLPIPVGISEARFSDPAFCGASIRFSPSNDPASCGGWNTYTSSPTSDSKVRAVINGLTDGTFTPPETIANQTSFNFSGGTLSNQTFIDFQTLFDKMKVINDHFLSDGTTLNPSPVDDDEDPTTWTTTVPVYFSADCANPHGSILIVGFAKVTIFNVVGPPDKIIDARIVCGIEPGQGGGSNPFGVLEEGASLVK